MLKKVHRFKQTPHSFSNLLLSLVLTFLPFSVFALGGDTPVGEGLQYVIDAMTGSTGIAIATLAVIVVGLLAKAGYLKWTHVFSVAVGIAIVFGSTAIVRGFASYVHG